MTAEDQAKPSGEESTSDTSQSDIETSADAAPALNRAQRRAMAHGKKGAGGLNPAMPNSQQRGFGGNSHAKGGQARFPRTGHK